MIKIIKIILLIALTLTTSLKSLYANEKNPNWTVGSIDR